MGLYIVSYDSGAKGRGKEGKPYIYGIALVSANSSSAALTKIRERGFTPNPGYRYSYSEERAEELDLEIDDYMKEEAKREGTVVVWQTDSRERNRL